MMALRYKGKPYVGANRQADKFDPVCFCLFVAEAVPLDSSKCSVHTKLFYKCDICGCSCIDYRPRSEKKSPDHWPFCVCGHVAAEHN